MSVLDLPLAEPAATTPPQRRSDAPDVPAGNGRPLASGEAGATWAALTLTVNQMEKYNSIPKETGPSRLLFSRFLPPGRPGGDPGRWRGPGGRRQQSGWTFVGPVLSPREKEI